MKHALLIPFLLLTAPAFANEVQLRQSIDFDLDGDGVVDQIGILAEGCEGDQCPVELFTRDGSITLGYGALVETGYVSPEELGVNDPSSYPADVPVVQIDGVLMAFNGEIAYPVADMISKDALVMELANQSDIDWISSRLNADIDRDSIYKVVGDLSPAGGDIVYSVYSPSLGQTSAWFLRDSAGAEVARGFSLDYPRIYQNAQGLRILSVSQTGLGVMDVSFAPEG